MVTNFYTTNFRDQFFFRQGFHYYSKKFKGSNGHPWQVPLVMGKFFHMIPSVKTLAEGVVYKAMIAECIAPDRQNYGFLWVAFFPKLY